MCSLLTARACAHTCIKCAAVCIRLLAFQPRGCFPHNPPLLFPPLISPPCPYSFIKQTVALTSIIPVFPLKWKIAPLASRGDRRRETKGTCGEQGREEKKRREQGGRRQRRATLRQTLEACVKVVTAVGEKEQKKKTRWVRLAWDPSRLCEPQ